MLIDAHAHFDMYEDELDTVLAEVERRRILTLSNSLDPPSYRKNLEVASRSDLVVPLFGVHPWSAPEWAGRLEELAGAAAGTPMVGEIGLDHRFVEDESQYPAQREVLEFLLSEAGLHGRSVSLHTAGAEREILDALDRHGIERAIVHWYSGPFDVLEALAERGTYFTMGFGVTYHEHVRDLAAAIPEHLLLTETDNPGGHAWLTGRPGMPKLLPFAIEALAEIRGTTPAEIEATVERNFKRLVESDPHLGPVCGPLLEREAERDSER
jgi:TatD DNase family protein